MENMYAYYVSKQVKVGDFEKINTFNKFFLFRNKKDA